MKKQAHIGGVMSRLVLMGIATLPLGLAQVTQAVVVPAGSEDALAAAIAEAGPGGEVTLAAGVHHESSTVFVTIPVTINGEQGAIIKSDALADAPPPPFMIVPTLHIKNTHGVVVEDITFEPSREDMTAGTAFVIENAPNVVIRNNTVTGYQFGVLVQHGDNAAITGNHVYVVAEVGGRGIHTINGHDVQITDNVVVGGFIGIFLTGPHGQCRNHLVEETNMGIFLCQPRDIFNIGGKAEGSVVTANGWYVVDNETNNNQTGIIVIDGSFRNTLANNRGSGNAMYDMELAGDSERFGFFTPTSSENIVSQDADHPLTVKDCGVDNIVSGNVVMVDNAADPCF